MALRGGAQEVVVAADDVARRLGVDALLEGRRAGEVGEHDGHRLAHRRRRGDVRRGRPDHRVLRRIRGRTVRSHWLPRHTSRRSAQVMHRSLRRSARPLRSAFRRRRRCGGSRPSSVGPQRQAVVVLDRRRGAGEHGAQQLQLAVVGDVDPAGGDDGIDEAPRRGEPVVAPQLFSGIVDSVFGETLGVAIEQLVLTAAPGFGGEALAQEVTQVVGATALCGDLPVQRRQRRDRGR